MGSEQVMNPNRLCGTCAIATARLEVNVQRIYDGSDYETFDICHECYDEMLWPDDD